MAGSWLHRPALVTFGLKSVHRLTGISLPEVVLVLSLRLAALGLPHSGSVHCLCYLCDVVDTCQFSSSLDKCRSGMGPGLLVLH